MSQIHLIWAQSDNGVIGVDGGLPWHLPEDLEHFRKMTRGKTVIMGRKTWDSLPEQFRPLPSRMNIVLSRQPGWYPPGAWVVSTLSGALTMAGDDAWIIGGGNVYAQALPAATHVHVTRVYKSVEGDTLAPTLPESEWRVEESSGQLQSRTGLKYAITHYARVSATS